MAEDQAPSAEPVAVMDVLAAVEDDEALETDDPTPVDDDVAEEATEEATEEAAEEGTSELTGGPGDEQLGEAAAPRPPEPTDAPDPGEAPAAEEDDAGAPAADGEPRGGAETDARASTPDAEDDGTPDDDAVAPAAADGGVPPYVSWTVENVAGTPVGGATFEIAGPATYSFFSGTTWGTASPVEDCVSAPCTEADLDPDPGEFLVKTIGDHDVSANYRYRIREGTPPDGYTFDEAATWIELPGYRATPQAGAWSDETYDFGSFSVHPVGDFAPTCAAGVVYGLSANGYIREVTAGGSVANFGSRAPVSSFNGIGIGYGGRSVYAYERTNNAQTATVWTFDTTTGQWASTGASINSTVAGRTVQFVAGAVDLDTGRYYLGGFTSTGREFRIWEYAPTTGAITYKGYLDTSSGAGGAVNGDMAFNAAGDLFVGRGSGMSTTIFSVTGENLQAAAGGLIPSSYAATVTTMADVCGMAFDADGKAYLGSGSQLGSYDMPGWTGAGVVVASGLNSTDLATCSSPPTITIEKEVEGARVDPTDQFELRLHQGAQLIASQTTVGDEPGLQSVRLGPLPTVRNVELTFSERAAGTTDPHDYVASHRCLVDGEPLSSGTGTTGTISIPPRGKDVVCTFRNAPLIAEVTIYKLMADRDGADPEPYPGWTVGMSAAATTGQVTATLPETDTQTTGPDGDASWTIRFDDRDSRATVTISEEMQEGFQAAEDAVCYVNGTQSSFPGESGEIPAVGPGDEVSCAFTNQAAPATLQVDKQWVVDGVAYAHGEQPAGMTADLALVPPGDSDEAPQWGVERTGYVIGEDVTITETTGIDEGSFPGCTLTESTIAGPGLDGEHALDPAGVDVTLEDEANQYTVTNVVTCQTLTLTKQVENTFGGQLTSGDWDAGLFAQAEGEEPLVFDSGETRYLSAGTYTVTEDESQPGYELTGLTCDGGSFDEATNRLTIAAGESIGCTFTNADQPGSVTWSKVTAEGAAGSLLAGSQWQLSGPDGSTTTIVDCDADAAEECTGMDVDPAAGAFRLEDLTWGDYQLVETKAPPGYVLDPTVHTFTVAADDLAVAVGAIENTQYAGPALPLTGGLGRDHVYLAGSLVLLLSLTAVGVTRLHRRRFTRSAES